MPRRTGHAIHVLTVRALEGKSVLPFSKIVAQVKCSSWILRAALAFLIKADVVQQMHYEAGTLSTYDGEINGRTIYYRLTGRPLSPPTTGKYDANALATAWKTNAKVD